MENQFYNTQNLTLAAGLALFGCQHPRNEEGQIIPASNTFTKEILANLGYKGRPAMESAINAHKKGLTGILIYHFEQSEDQKEYCAGWAAMEDAVEKQDEEKKKNRVHPDTQMPVETIQVSHTDLGKMACLFDKKRKELSKLVRMTRPALALLEISTESTGERSSRITGSGTIRSIPL